MSIRFPIFRASRPLAAAALAAALPLAFAATPGSAQPAALTPYAQINAAAAQSPVTVRKLRGNVSMLDGSGGEITVLSTPEGFFLVDAGIAVSRDKILSALETLGPGKIRTVVTTHWHWDHADGNGWVRAEGAQILAHPQTIARLRQTIDVDEWQHVFPPVAPAALPTQAVEDLKTLRFGDESILIRPYAAAHTNGDLSVYFPREDVLATGDLWWNGLYPFIDHHVGGGIDGMIAAANENLAFVTDHTIIVPGHGPAGSKQDLVAFRDMLVAIRDNVAALKAQGKSLEETVAAKSTAAFDAKWGKAIISPDLFTLLVYQSL